MTTCPRIAFVCPSFNLSVHHYTLQSIRSFIEHTPRGMIIVVDDGSREWGQEVESSILDLQTDDHSVMVHHFRKWGGLTRSWNKGLELASTWAEYAIPGNNDILFTPDWWEGLIAALKTDKWALVGPLSNAPGVTAKGLQEIERYVQDYSLTDNTDYLAGVAAQLRAEKSGKVLPAQVNGFFSMAAMETWEKGKFDANHYYRPSNTRMPSGRINRTPLMTGNEDELQHRWNKLGLRSGIVLDSFIFHYRAVTRGDKYKRGNWYRIPENVNTVLSEVTDVPSGVHVRDGDNG